MNVKETRTGHFSGYKPGYYLQENLPSRAIKSLIVVQHFESLDLRQGKIYYKQDRNNYRRKG